MVFPKRCDKLANLYDLLRVETHGGLVQNDDGRHTHKSLGEAYPLAVTFRQVPYQTVFHVVKFGQVHDLADVRHPGGLRQAFQVRCEIKILTHPHVAVYRRHLGEVAHAFFGRLRLGVYVVSLHDDLAGGGSDVSRQHIERRGFPGSVWPQEPVNVSRIESQVKVVHGHSVAVYFCQIL